MRDLLLCGHVVVKTLNLECYWSACRTCSTIIFLHSTNQIIVFSSCRCRCRRPCLNSLVWTHEQGTRTQREEMCARAGRAEERSERHAWSVQKNKGKARATLKPLLHVETLSWNLCATALWNMFQQALHCVTWSVSWNFLNFCCETSFTKSRTAFYFCNDRSGDKNESFTV